MIKASLFISPKMFPFTQNWVGTQRAAGREKALTFSLLSPACHNLTCIFLIIANLMKKYPNPKTQQGLMDSSWQEALAAMRTKRKGYRGATERQRCSHLESPFLPSQP